MKLNYRLTHWYKTKEELQSVVDPLKQHGGQYKVDHAKNGSNYKKWAVFVPEPEECKNCGRNLTDGKCPECDRVVK